MTAYVYRVALIVPDPQREAANRIAGVMGWGAACYSVPLSVDGLEPASHWGLSTAATQSFVTGLLMAETGNTPQGVDPADMTAVLPVLMSAINSGDTEPGGQFDELARIAGLQRVFSGL